MNFARESTLIIGYGNPLRGDDGVGPYAASELRRWGLQALDVQQLTPELAEAVAAVELVIFIDADSRLRPGEVHVAHVLPDENPAGPMEHHATPQGLLRLSRDVYGRAPHALLVTVGGESFELGSGLSESALRGIEEIVDICMNPV